MISFDDTIAAIATAPGTGAIAVVRLSGTKAFSIAQKLFQRRGQADKEAKLTLSSHHALVGHIMDEKTASIVDEVVLTPFQAPHTYTGEDLIEISCHGGPVVTAQILSLALASGARLAERGEFTKRAFLSGRLDLTQAEAVLDIIQAKTNRGSRAALSALEGGLGKRINEVRDQLLAVLTRIVAGLDFPEEIGDAPEPDVQQVVSRSLETLIELARTARSGRFLREGLRLAIVGRPNAGKSSLLNQLLKFERAIVTDIPGTTRDSLEEVLDIQGAPVVLVDTAGIRATDDTVEKIGIERAKTVLKECDLALLVIDLKEGFGEPEKMILELIGERPFIAVGNKIDVSATGDRQHCGFGANCCCQVNISAMNGTNIEQLSAAIEKFVFSDESTKEGPSLNVRQSALCIKATEALQAVLVTLKEGYPQDCLATDLKTAVDSLSEISGQSVSEEVITQVFASFCIGK
jgi:tRNA modification GTPase